MDEQREHVIEEIEYVLNPTKYGYPIPSMLRGVLHDALNLLIGGRRESAKIRRVISILDYVRKGGIAPEDATQITTCMDILETIGGKR